MPEVGQLAVELPTPAIAVSAVSRYSVLSHLASLANNDGKTKQFDDAESIAPLDIRSKGSLS